MKTTETLARFVVDTGYEDIPEEAVERAKRTGLDCLGATLAGCALPGSQAFARYARKLGGSPQAAIIGAGFRAAVPDAALVNGTVAHALDYDDCGMKVGHPSALVLPVALGLGEYLQASGKEVLAAYIRERLPQRGGGRSHGAGGCDRQPGYHRGEKRLPGCPGRGRPI